MQKYHPNLGKQSEGAKIGTISNQFLEVQDHSLFQSSCRYIQQSSHPWKKASAQRNNQSVVILVILKKYENNLFLEQKSAFQTLKANP